MPSGRLSRFVRFGGVASRIAAGAALGGAGQLARGQRPDLQGLLLTPGNVRRFADELARMRGAAMKVGQLVSMDAGDFLPPELADIMGRLRADADYMPPKQLRSVLDGEWGKGWLSRFRSFDVRPLAAASIGQVHRARTKDGRDLALKIQYPRIRDSIDSDVANVGTLLRLSGMAPPGLDLGPFLEEAKRQLHEEADYAREAEQLRRFGALLADDPGFAVPRVHDDYTTPNVLAMDFLDGVPVEAMAGAPQERRDRIAGRLIDLGLRELFEFRLVQTDPNFANYRYDPEGERVILLDFGATRAYAPETVEAQRVLMRAALDGDREAMRQAAIGAGLFAPDTAPHHQDQVLAMIEMGAAPLHRGERFDFADRALSSRLKEAGMALAADQGFEHVPPMDTLYLQRKFAGLYLLARRLGARVDLGPMAAKYL